MRELETELRRADQAVAVVEAQAGSVAAAPRIDAEPTATTGDGGTAATHAEFVAVSAHDTAFIGGVPS